MKDKKEMKEHVFPSYEVFIFHFYLVLKRTLFEFPLNIFENEHPFLSQ